MSESYTYEHVCPNCGIKWEETRFKPYKRKIYKKKCKSCLGGKSEGNDVKPVYTLSSNNNDSCGNCKFFNALKDTDNETWGKCALGKYSDHHLVHKMLEKEGKYVYSLDWCPDYEKDD